VLPPTSLLEFINIKSSKKLNYYLKSDQAVTGLLFNSSASNAKVTEISNSSLDVQAEFWAPDEDFDEETVGSGNYYMLVYSPKNVSANSQIVYVDGASGISSRSNSDGLGSGRRLQETSGDSSTNLYFSEYEMDEKFNAKKGLPWWAILLIILAVLLLILLIILLICCCCCCCCGRGDKEKKKRTSHHKEIHYHTTIIKEKKKQSNHTSLPNNNERIPRTKNVEVKSFSAYNQSLYEDGFYPPVMQKKGDSKVNNYIGENDLNPAM
jgi:hypothetical protein